VHKYIKKKSTYQSLTKKEEEQERALVKIFIYLKKTTSLSLTLSLHSFWAFFFFFWLKGNILTYELINRVRVALDTSNAKASSTCAGALGK
jgi:hypothetical protein